jgi:hypothetical protein
MSGRAALPALALAAVLALLPVGTAGAANWFELNFLLSGPRHDGILPACDSPGMLNKIVGRFSDKEKRFWDDRLRIVAFEQIRETAFRPWAPNTIPRRFCSAVVEISDGVKRPIHYSINEDTGMAGAWNGIEWCVDGLDRNWAFSPGCRMARP